MSADIYHYIQWLHMHVQQHDQMILELRTQLREMQEKLKAVEGKHPVHVGTITYKFDQLKVETLEGTLNIGLNPQDLQGIEDFAVNGQTTGAPSPPAEQMKRSIEIEEQILNYLEDEFPAIFAATQEKMGLPPNDAYLAFVKEDIKKQLPSRIDYHLKNTGDARQEAQGDFIETVTNQIKKEIETGIQAFLGNLPEGMKGMNNS